jgi:hypothetical protein
MAMKVIRLSFIALVGLIGACATTPRQEPFTAKLVMVREVVSSDNVKGITDTFTREGRIHVHAAFTGPAVASPESHAVLLKWFNGNALIFERSGSYVFKTSPYYMWTGTSGTALGIGTCRVELYVDGKFVAAREFTVLE